MDDEAQKMVALKKAYAEIILNTGKEAAARIMVSERKAFRFQRDLVATKDEALRMLVRLKQMLDSKAAEAELTSLNQQRKIEELEAQLQEAEDVITDLREDLRRVDEELEKARSDKVQPLNGLIVGEHGSFSVNSTSHPVMPSLSSSGLVTVTISDVNHMSTNGVLDNKCCNARQAEQSSFSNLDKLYPHNSDIASIIMKRKEPELYRNGCTQRIRAFERSLMDGNLLPSGSVDNDNSLGKIESTVKVSDKNSLKTNKMEMVKKGSRGEVKKPVKFRTSWKKTRYGKVKTSGKGHHSQLTKTRPVISDLERNSVNGNDGSTDGKYVMPSSNEANMDKTETLNGEEKFQPIKCHYKDEARVIQKGKRKRKMRNGSDTNNSLACPPCQPTKPSEPSSVLSRCRTFEYLVNGGIKFGEDQSNPIENETKIKSLPRLDPGVTLINSDMDPVSGSTSVTLSAKAVNKLEHISDAAEMMKETMSVKQESGVTDNSLSLSLNLDTINVPSVNSELKSEQLIKSLSHADNNNLLKYTFQRKRKREAANKSDETASPDKKSTQRECAAPDQQKSSLIDESSRDSRRLVQVARQLISLSGKRWR